MRTYEITYITVTEESPNAESVREALTANNATITSVNAWGGRRKLAYPIKKQDQAFYTTVVFEAEPSALKPIETALRGNDNIIRTLVVHHEPSTALNRPAATDSPESKPKEVAETSEKAPEATEEVAAPAETTEKPKRTKKEPAQPDPSLDEKLDQLLSEDITK